MPLTEAGASLLGTTISAGLSAAATLGSAGMSQGMTKLARKENYEYNELAAKNAFTRQQLMQEYLQRLQYKQFYDLESPKAIMQQLREAGLSPSVFANGALGNSISGVTTPGAAPQGAGASGLNPSFMPINMNGLLADTALKFAQANREQAEADRINGVNKRGQAEIEKLLSEKLGIEASTNYTKMLEAHEKILTDIDNKSSESRINEIYYNSEIAAKNAEKLTFSIIREYNNAVFEEQTLQTRINRENLLNKEVNSRILLNKANIGLSKAQTEQVATQMDKWGAEIVQGFIHLANENKRTESYDEYVKNLHQFQEDQINNFTRQLNINEDQFTRRQKLEWTKTIMSFFNANMDRGANMLTSIIDLSK